LVHPQTLDSLNFLSKDLNIATSNTEIAIDEEGTKTGIKIPVTYDYPIESGTGYIVEQVTEDIGMNFDAYNKCRQKKTKTVCLGELDDDIQQNIDTFKINKERELEELQRETFENELNF